MRTNPAVCATLLCYAASGTDFGVPGMRHPGLTLAIWRPGKYLTSLVAICLASLGDYTSLDFSQVRSVPIVVLAF
eukprot:3940881-Rhodomonas_salina.1